MAVAVLVGGAPFELPAEIGHDLGPGSQLFVQEAQGGEWTASSTVARQAAIRAGIPVGRAWVIPQGWS